jgi:hypothetical protein
MRRAGCGAAALLFACVTQAAAQSSELRAQCGTASGAAVRGLCEAVADASVILQPRAALALTGGNAVPGSASTLGMRLGSLPRVSANLRITAAAVSLPPIERVGSRDNINFPLGSINADASIGVYQGLALLPTVGGFGSLDLLGSVGVLPLPRGEGFNDSAPVSWAVGARVGLLRESFTAPGVSIDVLHRRVGSLSWGSPDLTEEDVHLQHNGVRVTSVRGTVGKRFFGFGVTGGAAWDRSTADVHARLRDPVVLDPGRVLEIRQQGLSTTRTALFGNASLTIMILNLATELGWQRGAAPLEGATDRLQRGGLFGGVAVRLAI